MSDGLEQNLSLAGKIICITGSASGIGLATSLLLYERGATIAISDKNAAGLAEVDDTLSKIAKKAGQDYFSTAVDVTQSNEVEAWIASIVSRFGRLDGAANIAGVGDGAICKIVDKTDDGFDSAVNTNLRGVWNCMRAQLIHMRQGASIVNVSSVAGLVGTPGVGLYAAAKGGINTLTATAAKEHGPMGIRVNAIAPGVVLTPALLGAGRVYLEPGIANTPLGRGAEPVEISKPIAFLLSEDASFVTGVVLRCDGGTAAVGH